MKHEIRNQILPWNLIETTVTTVHETQSKRRFQEIRLPKEHHDALLKLLPSFWRFCWETLGGGGGFLKLSFQKNRNLPQAQWRFLDLKFPRLWLTMRLGTWGIVPIWILIALPPDQRQVLAFDCCINSCGQKVQQKKVIWMNEFKKVTKPTKSPNRQFFLHIISH